MRLNRKVKRNSAAGKNMLKYPAAGFRYLVFIMLPVVAIIATVYFISVAAGSAFRINKLIFTGNAHLGDEELRKLAGLEGGGNMFLISGREIFEKMSGSPWIRSVSIRKELPDRLHILIREAEPFALLDMKGRLFIVDEKGRMLEELKDSLIPFLPVISGNPFGKKEVFSEAINLAGAIKEVGLLAKKDHIEIIAYKPQEMAVNLDGIVVKVGTGEYREKLVRLMELEEEIKGRNIPLDYIDLRFANRIVVKPVNEVIH